MQRLSIARGGLLIGSATHEIFFEYLVSSRRVWRKGTTREKKRCARPLTHIRLGWVSTTAAGRTITDIIGYSPMPSNFLYLVRTITRSTTISTQGERHTTTPSRRTSSFTRLLENYHRFYPRRREGRTGASPSASMNVLLSDYHRGSFTICNYSTNLSHPVRVIQVF